MARKFLARLGALLRSIKTQASRRLRRPFSLEELLERAGVSRSTSPELLEAARVAGLALDGDDGDGDGNDDDGDDEDKEDDEDKGDGDDDTDWKWESRKHEKRSKSEKARAEKLQEQLDEEKAKSQTDQEKEREKIRKEARDEAKSEVEEERRNDRLEVAVAKRAKEFADVDDVLLNVERAIRDGDITEDDIFDDKGKVQTKALNKELDELLERKPHLKAGGSKRPAGRANGGEGAAGDESGDMNDLIRRKAGIRG